MLPSRLLSSTSSSKTPVLNATATPPPGAALQPMWCTYTTTTKSPGSWLNTTRPMDPPKSGKDQLSRSPLHFEPTVIDTEVKKDLSVRQCYHSHGNAKSATTDLPRQLDRLP